ncbi:MAG: AI-2E family transporter [Candidatus Dadabacteria bacterium]
MARNTIDTNLIRQIFFIALIILVGIVLFNQLSFFIPALLGAITFYVLMRGRMFYLIEKRKWKRSLAAWTLMLLSFFIILVPFGLLGNIIYSRIAYVVAHSAELLANLQIAVNRLNQKTGYTIIDPTSVSKIAPFIANLLPRILNVTFNTVSQIASMYFLLYFMLVNGPEMEEWLYEYIPLKQSNVKLVGHEVRTMVVSNTIGIPLIALIQGVVALIGFLIVGLPDAWLWFVALSISAMVPVVGGMLVYGPLTIMLFVQGHNVQGLILGLWCFIIVGLSDNFFRFLLNKKLGNIHPLITVFGVIIGVQLFGFIGLIFGPLLISMFILLVRIYSSEFITKKRELPHEQ